MQATSLSLVGLCAATKLLDGGVFPASEGFSVQPQRVSLGRFPNSGAAQLDLRQPMSCSHISRSHVVPSRVVPFAGVPSATGVSSALSMARPAEGGEGVEGEKRLNAGVPRGLAALWSGVTKLATHNPRPSGDASDGPVPEGARRLSSLCTDEGADTCSIEAEGCGISSIIDCLENGDYDKHTCQRLTYALCESSVDQLSPQTVVPEVAVQRLADADKALVDGRMMDAVAAFDDLREWFSASVCQSLEETLCVMLHRTPVSFYRNPTAKLPNGQEIKPDSYRGGYHGTAHVPPALALKQGLAVRGPNTDLLDHVQEAGNSAFRGATPTVSDPDGLFGAALWANEGGWVYDIRHVPTWNADLNLQGRRARELGYGDNLLTGEVELVIPGYIPPENIKRYGQVEMVHGIACVRTWHENPAYIERYHL